MSLPNYENVKNSKKIYTYILTRPILYETTGRKTLRPLSYCTLQLPLLELKEAILQVIHTLI